jgi:hypothetical protein
MFRRRLERLIERAERNRETGTNRNDLKQNGEDEKLARKPTLVRRDICQRSFVERFSGWGEGALS